MGLNKAEDFTFDLCRRSFLSLWSYTNPQARHGKELCDVLIVCDPHIAIISVKEVVAGNGAKGETNWARWRRRAVDASCRQIYGAERSLESVSHVTRSDGSQGLPIPLVGERRIHRVAVAFGANGKAPLQWGDFGKGFVHVFDEVSLQIVMRELDTISDFVGYLQAKENLRSNVISNRAGEEDLLALYLHRGRQFPTNYDRIVIDNGLWDKLVAKPEFMARKAADEESYIWDRIIDEMAQAIIDNRLEYGPGLSKSEMTVRMMAKEDRFARRILSQAFNQFMALAAQRKVESRMLRSPSAVVYVFLALPPGSDRRLRLEQLRMRCFVARGQYRGFSKVVGIATEVYERGKGHSFDVVSLQKESWTDDYQRLVEKMQRDLGYFANPVASEAHVDELPGASPDKKTSI